MSIGHPPEQFRYLFWDVDWSRLDVELHPDLIIERVLNLGDHRALRWLFQQYSQDEIPRMARTTG